jgi:hypothetical protein
MSAGRIGSARLWPDTETRRTNSFGHPRPSLLDRIVAMLTKLGQRGYAVHEEPTVYRADQIDPDTGTDADADGR